MTKLISLLLLAVAAFAQPHGNVLVPNSRPWIANVVIDAPDPVAASRPAPPALLCSIVNPILQPDLATRPETVDALLACVDKFQAEWTKYKAINLYLNNVANWRINAAARPDLVQPTKPQPPAGYVPPPSLFLFDKPAAEARPKVGAQVKPGMYLASGDDPAGSVIDFDGKRLVKVTSPTPFGLASWWEVIGGTN